MKIRGKYILNTFMSFFQLRSGLEDSSQEDMVKVLHLFPRVFYLILK